MRHVPTPPRGLQLMSTAPEADGPASGVGGARCATSVATRARLTAPHTCPLPMLGHYSRDRIRQGRLSCAAGACGPSRWPSPSSSCTWCSARRQRTAAPGTRGAADVGTARRAAPVVNLLVNQLTDAPQVASPRCWTAPRGGWFRESTSLRWRGAHPGQAPWRAATGRQFGIRTADRRAGGSRRGRPVHAGRHAGRAVRRWRLSLAAAAGPLRRTRRATPWSNRPQPTRLGLGSGRFRPGGRCPGRPSVARVGFAAVWSRCGRACDRLGLPVGGGRDTAALDAFRGRPNPTDTPPRPPVTAPVSGWLRGFGPTTRCGTFRPPWPFGPVPAMVWRWTRSRTRYGTSTRDAGTMTSFGRNHRHRRKYGDILQTHRYAPLGPAPRRRALGVLSLPLWMAPSSLGREQWTRRTPVSSPRFASVQCPGGVRLVRSMFDLTRPVDVTGTVLDITVFARQHKPTRRPGRLGPPRHPSLLRLRGRRSTTCCAHGLSTDLVRALSFPWPPTPPDRDLACALSPRLRTRRPVRLVVPGWSRYVKSLKGVRFDYTATPSLHGQ